MKTKTLRWRALSVAMLATLILFPVWSLAAEGKTGGGKAWEKAQGKRFLDGEFGQRIESHIQRLEAATTNHPQMPEALKTALRQIIEDLKVNKDLMDKLAADRQAGNKEAVKTGFHELREAQLKLLHDRLALIDARIAGIEGRLAKHPDAPEGLKAAIGKLVADLKDRKADLQKLIADLQSKNREAVKADRAELKKGREEIKEDRRELREELREHRR